MGARSFRPLAAALAAGLALGGAFAQAPAPAAAGTPHLRFDTTEVNLGKVIRGEDAVATFTYHNTGDAPLHILSAKPG